MYQAERCHVPAYTPYTHPGYTPLHAAVLSRTSAVRVRQCSEVTLPPRFPASVRDGTHYQENMPLNLWLFTMHSNGKELSPEA